MDILILPSCRREVISSLLLLLFINAFDIGDDEVDLLFSNKAFIGEHQSLVKAIDNRGVGVINRGLDIFFIHHHFGLFPIDGNFAHGSPETEIGGADQLRSVRGVTGITPVFGVISAVTTIFTGDTSARIIAREQPMKFAAMEALYEGQTHAPLVAIGAMRTDTTLVPNPREEFIFKIEIPNALSYMVFLTPSGFVAGINDMVYGNEEQGIIPYQERIDRGAVAISTLKELKRAKDRGDEATFAAMKAKFDDPQWVEDYYKYFGYGYYQDRPIESLIPNVKMNFYAFHIMVVLGGHFLILSIVALLLSMKNRWGDKKWLLWVALLTLPLPWIASQAGWVVAEVGRQPWSLLRTTSHGIWFSGAGTVFVVLSLFFLAGFNNTAFYPSSYDLQSSLTIQNSSSSKFTLVAMSYVSLAVPFVFGYIIYAWRAINVSKIDESEVTAGDDTHIY
jgi:cytochrome bd-type quinol oxidase subunit 1